MLGSPSRLEELSDGSLDSLASQETTQRKEQQHQNRFVHANIFHVKNLLFPFNRLKN